MDDLAGFRQVNELPYFNACINEAGRMHPPLGLPLERVVPAQGAMVCGKYLPGGTVVGMSAWVVHRDPDAFGEDCDIWRPERWLCDGEKRRKMENALLTVSDLIDAPPNTSFTRFDGLAYHHQPGIVTDFFT